MKTTKRSTDPDIFVIDKFMTASECAIIVSNAICTLPCATEAGDSSFRKCKECMAFERYVPLARIHNLFPVDATRFEPIAMIRYDTGGEYDLHYDHFERHVPNSGNRIATIIIYLNDSDADTHFPKLDISIKPRTGRCLVFFPCHMDGTPDLRTLHEARRVTVGQKYILQTWLRQRTLTSV